MIARTLVTFLAVLLGIVIGVAALAFALDAISSMLSGEQQDSVDAPSEYPPIDEGQRKQRLQFWKHFEAQP